MAHIKNTFVNVKNCFGTIACDTVILCILIATENYNVLF